MDPAPDDDDGAASRVRRYHVVGFKWIDELNSINSILSFLRLFKYLRSNPGLAQLGDTIYKASLEMGPVCIILGVCVVAYAAAFQLAFGSELFEYSDQVRGPARYPSSPKRRRETSTGGLFTNPRRRARIFGSRHFR